MNRRLGEINGLNGLRKAGEQLADWVVSAAEERWPNCIRWFAYVDEDVTKTLLDDIWENARERWGDDLILLRDGLVNVERQFLKASGPLA